jgi:hypothetical protein
MEGKTLTLIKITLIIISQIHQKNKIKYYFTTVNLNFVLEVTRLNTYSYIMKLICVRLITSLMFYDFVYTYIHTLWNTNTPRIRRISIGHMSILNTDTYNYIKLCLFFSNYYRYRHVSVRFVSVLHSTYITRLSFDTFDQTGF